MTVIRRTTPRGGMRSTGTNALHVRGGAVLNTISYIEVRFGELGVDMLMKALTEDERRALRRCFSESWFDFALWVKILAFAGRELADDAEECCRDMGRSAAEVDMDVRFRGWHRSPKTSPRLVMEQLVLAWPYYYDFGTVEVAGRVGAQRLPVRFTELPLTHECHLWRMCGWVERAVQLLSDPGAVVHGQMVTGADGLGGYEVNIDWEFLEGMDDV